MRLLVTGGAGFIGSALIRKILSNTNMSVLNVDKLTYAGNLDSLLAVEGSSRYEFFRCDIVDEEAVEELFLTYRPNAVIHLAAESHVDRSIDGPADFVRTNILGTFTLLQAARKYYRTLSVSEAEGFRFLHVSTDEVFGDLAPHDSPFDEHHSYNPSSPYSASKASADHLVRAWGRTYGLPVIITNCSNNYGPFQFPEKFIAHIILNALHGKPLPIYGNGTQIRDWLYVDDHAQALLTVVARGVPGSSYNIGGGNEIRNIDVVETICRALEDLAPNKKPKGLGLFRDLITYVEDRPGHDTRYAINGAKIKDELEWEPSENFETGLRNTILWYLDNSLWWERILSGEYEMERIGDSN